MQRKIECYRAGEAPELMAQAWRLRHRVFRERLGWEVASVDLLEIDPLDRLAVHLAATDRGRVVAYLRMLPTTGPYLLERSFAHLVPGGAPRALDVWEVSRFAADPDHPDHLVMARALVRAGMTQGALLGASRLIALTEPPFERFLRQCGVNVTRDLGPVIVGQSHHGDVQAVLISAAIEPALRIANSSSKPVDDRTAA